MNAVNKLTFINENQKSRGSIKRRKQRAVFRGILEKRNKSGKNVASQFFPSLFFSVINAPATTRLSFRKPNV